MIPINIESELIEIDDPLDTTIFSLGEHFWELSPESDNPGRPYEQAIKDGLKVALQ